MHPLLEAQYLGSDLVAYRENPEPERRKHEKFMLCQRHVRRVLTPKAEI